METKAINKDNLNELMQLPFVAEPTVVVNDIPLDQTSVSQTFISNLNQSWSTLLAAFVIALVVTTFTYQLPFEQQLTQPQVTAITPVNLISLTNQVRAEQGLNTLGANEELNLAAANKVKAIFANQYFSHTGKDGEKFSSWIKQAGYNHYEIVGENLALGYFDQQAMMNAWMNSPKHKENIVSPFYQDIGMAAATGEFHGKNTTIVVQLFGKQIPSQTNSSATITANISR